MQKTEIAKTVESYLDEIDYSIDPSYRPSDFAINFVNFIKLVNDGNMENLTPVVHFKMLDNFVDNPELDTINMCHRGIAKALALTEKVYTPYGEKTIQDIQRGDLIYGEDGTPTYVMGKSEVFNKPMYKITLADGRSIKVSEDHINTVIHRRQKRVDGKRVNYLDRRNLTTQELLGLQLHATRTPTEKNPKGKEARFWIPLCSPVQFPTQDLPIDPYTLGLLLGDGSMDKVTGFARLHAHKDDYETYLNHIPYKIGSINKSNDCYSISILGLGKAIKELHLNRTGLTKFIPKMYQVGSAKQRQELLQGLMDTDGTIYQNGGMAYTTVSEQLALDVCDLVRSLGGIASISKGDTDSPLGVYFRVNIRINLSVFKLSRKLCRQRFNAPDRVAIESIENIPTEPSQCIMVSNHTKTFLTTGYTVTHNSTLKEYLILYLAVFRDLPGLGEVPYAIYVSDSIENGVKKMRKSLEFRVNNSQFLQNYLDMGKTKFTDLRWEFVNKEGKSLVISGFGAKALSLDSTLFTEYGRTTIGDVQVGDEIYGADGKLCTVTKKSEIFHKPMYRLTLKDGRSIKVSEDHINSVVVRKTRSSKLEDLDLTTKELLDIDFKYDQNGKKGQLAYVRNCKPVEFPEEKLPVDPYTLGVILGDGRIRRDCGSVELTGHVDDFPTYYENIPYEFGKYQIDKRNTNVKTQSIRKVGKELYRMALNVHGNDKFIPEAYLRGSIAQRLALLQGLMDTDGTVSTRKTTCVTSFCSNSKDLIDGVMEIVYSLGGYCILGRTGEKAYRVQIHLNMPMFRLPRKKALQKLTRNEMVGIESLERIADEPSQCIAVDNEERQFITEMFFRTHNTGVRGTRENNSRPVLALLDDLISDEDARSPTIIEKVEETIYKAIDYALHPTKRKIIWSGTPFNAKDPLYKAVESGAWAVNVYPVCEKFPCEKDEFRGSWEDRFDYSYVLKQYTKAFKSGKVDTFNQELMLRIMSDEDRLIHEQDIVFYNQESLLANRAFFNYYITTDFATSDKQAADFSVISVWALSHTGEWYWVDGICQKQLMDANINDLFRLAQKWKPQEVGIEVSGQQGGFIPWIQDEMLKRNVFFNLASENNKKQPGIMPNTNKLQRFNIVVPWFKMKRIKFPMELLDTDPCMIECMDELKLASPAGFKSKHDDFIDTISMLASLNTWLPSEQGFTTSVGNVESFWEDDPTASDGYDHIDSYLV